eukprot:CAMPEP_0201558962 /NCGR_PEP_ID=MMETSP0173_2-20130828/70948_1 /ASSEMBLY_ACC=CAM_ASM_000268 /TAXON_ID=218659 /ORGANISM="Vexillifera sp., Strain DIVA3 564/2" /LENGTH=84 /DNA_ID=CAMNT_0047972651 /DNA_START=1 /DNA_END=251 /DNA_ORIENTATION=-
MMDAHPHYSRTLSASELEKEYPSSTATNSNIDNRSQSSWWSSPAVSSSASSSAPYSSFSSSVHKFVVEIRTQELDDAQGDQRFP